MVDGPSATLAAVFLKRGDMCVLTCDDEDGESRADERSIGICESTDVGTTVGGRGILYHQWSSWQHLQWWTERERGREGGREGGKERERNEMCECVILLTLA